MQRAQAFCTTPRPRATRKRVDRAHTQMIAMRLKSLLFAMLPSAAASVPPPLPVPRTVNGTGHTGNGTGHTGPSPVIEPAARAAVSNQLSINSTPGRDRDVTNPCRFPAASRAMNQNPDPDSNDARALCLHHRSSSSSKCPKPYTQSGKFCCFGPPMAPECYKWSD